MEHKDMARALGWFSVALGLTQLTAPRRLSSAIGISPSPILMRMLALREIASGLGILSQAKPAPWVGSRVAGDAMDLGLLGLGLLSGGTSRARLVAATAAVGGVTALDVLATRRMMEAERGLSISHSITINRPADVLYSFWRDVQNLPKVMRFVESITTFDATRSHWVARSPIGHRIEWDSEIVQDQPNEMISWRSLETAEIWHSGVIRFRPAHEKRGTIVQLQMEYRTPFGGLADIVARLFQGAVRDEVKMALRPFKQLMETGEIATTRGQPVGRTHPSMIRALERLTGTSESPAAGNAQTSRSPQNQPPQLQE